MGGDLAHTHLVKGLDYALLQKIRAEQARKDEEDMKIQEEILDMKSKSDRKLEDKEDLTMVRHPMAKKINRMLFETEIPKKVCSFENCRKFENTCFRKYSPQNFCSDR